MISRDNSPKGLFGRMHFIECKNVGTSELPAYSVAEITGAVESSERIVLTVQPVTDFGWRSCVVTIGPAKIAAGDRGACLDERCCFVTYTPGGSLPQKGETWGPVEDETEVHRHVPGGLVLRDGADGRVLIQRYEPGIVWGQTRAKLMPGATGGVDLYRYDANSGGNGSLVIVDNRTFDVTEPTGVIDPIEVGTFVYASWSQQAGKWILQGFVC